MNEKKELTLKKNLIGKYLTTIIIYVIFFVICDKYIRFSKTTFQILFYLHFSFSFISIFIARKVTSYNHRFFLHPVSYIGQMQVHGVSNMRAYWFYLIFCVLMANISLMFGLILHLYYNYLKHVNLLVFFLYFTAFSTVIQGTIQIDQFKLIHIIATACVFAGITAVNISLLIFYKNVGVFIEISLFYRIFAFVFLGLSILYLLSYIAQIRPGFFQKFWIFALSIILLTNGLLFCQIDHIDFG
ncbi:hypothetical protein [Candidatus Harpocratesius sp.]